MSIIKVILIIAFFVVLAIKPTYFARRGIFEGEEFEKAYCLIIPLWYALYFKMRFGCCHILTYKQFFALAEKASTL